MYLEANKEQARYRQTSIEVSNMEKWYGCCFEDEIIASNINATFYPVRKKEQGVLRVLRV